MYQKLLIDPRVPAPLPFAYLERSLCRCGQALKLSRYYDGPDKPIDTLYTTKTYSYRNRVALRQLFQELLIKMKDYRLVDNSLKYLDSNLVSLKADEYNGTLKATWDSSSDYRHINQMSNEW